MDSTCPYKYVQIYTAPTQTGSLPVALLCSSPSDAIAPTDQTHSSVEAMTPTNQHTNARLNLLSNVPNRATTHDSPTNQQVSKYNNMRLEETPTAVSKYRSACNFRVTRFRRLILFRFGGFALSPRGAAVPPPTVAGAGV